MAQLTREDAELLGIEFTLASIAAARALGRRTAEELRDQTTPTTSAGGTSTVFGGRYYKQLHLSLSKWCDFVDYFDVPVMDESGASDAVLRDFVTYLMTAARERVSW